MPDEEKILARGATMGAPPDVRTAGAERADAHTPGPWRLGRPAPYYAKAVIAQSPTFTKAYVPIADIPDNLRAGEASANARLIAAAPQMLQALHAAAHALRSYQYGNAAPALAEAVALACELAIAEAEGSALS